MKKLGKIASLVVLILVMSVSFAFASDLSFEKAYPGDGQTGVSLDNFGVKLTFSSKFSSDILKDSNDKCFTLVGPYLSKNIDEESYSFPLKVLYDGSNDILVLIKNDDNTIMSLKSASDYTLTISGSLKDDNGNELGQDQVIHFTTLNQQRNNTVNTIMMFGMFGVIILVTMRSTKKQAEKTDKKEKKDQTVNPYKEAKKTGKTVEQVVEETEKKKKKNSKNKKNEKVVNSNVLYLNSDEYYVTTLRAIPSENSEFVRVYKEEKARRREEEKARNKQARAQKKGKKK